MGIAKRTAHATTATVAAIVDTRSDDALTGIPANYFDHRADQLEEAAAKLEDEKEQKLAQLKAEKADKLARIDMQKADLLAALEEERAQVAAEMEKQEDQLVADLEDEQAQLEEQAAGFRHQAERYHRNKRRCTYLDCLYGKASVPSERAGKLLFQGLIIGGMVSIMATFNGYRHSGMEFFYAYHWMYPFIFCLTFIVREAFMNKITDHLIANFIVPRFEGGMRNFVITLVNTVLMVPLMASIVTAILYGVDNLAMSLLEQVPITFVVALFVNYLIVGPIVKMIYNNLIVANDENGETGVYNKLQDLAMPIMSAFNS